MAAVRLSVKDTPRCPTFSEQANPKGRCSLKWKARRARWRATEERTFGAWLSLSLSMDVQDNFAANLTYQNSRGLGVRSGIRMNDRRPEYLKFYRPSAEHLRTRRSKGIWRTVAGLKRYSLKNNLL